MATVRIQVRRGTASQWTSTNPILAAGEMGVETDSNLFKFGNGTSTWTALSYANNSDVSIGEISQDAINNALSLGAGLTKTYNDGTNTIQITVDSDVVALKSYVDTAVSDLANTADVTYILQDDRGAVNGVASLNAQGKVPTSEIDLTVMATREYADYLQTQDLYALSTHTGKTTDVHGIADTAALVTNTSLSSSLDTLTTNLQGYADGAVSAETDARVLAIQAEATDRAEAISTEETNRNLAISSAQDAAESFATAEVSAHNLGTANVHGIANTLDLATKSYADTAADNAETAATSAASTALSSHASDTTSVHGIADTSLLALKSEVAAVTATTLGLGNVDNTSDLSKPVSTATQTAIATAKSEAVAEVTAVIDAAPSALNTLNELAAALGDDANFASTVTTSLDGKVNSYTPIIPKTASYTLSALSERDSLIEVSSSSATTITIPADSAVNYPVGTSVDILQTSTGQVTIAGAGGVTVNATPGLKLRTQWSSASLLKRAANTWIVMGDLSA